MPSLSRTSHHLHAQFNRRDRIEAKPEYNAATYDHSPEASAESSEELEQSEDVSEPEGKREGKGKRKGDLAYDAPTDLAHSRASKRARNVHQASRAHSAWKPPRILSTKENGDEEKKSYTPSPGGGSISHSSKRKRDSTFGLGPVSSSAPPPTMEEDDLLFGIDRNQMTYSSQKSSQGYGTQTKNIHAPTGKERKLDAFKQTGNRKSDQSNMGELHVPRMSSFSAMDLTSPGPTTPFRIPPSTLPDTSKDTKPRARIRRPPPLEGHRLKLSNYKHTRPSSQDSSSGLSEPPTSDAIEQHEASEIYERELQELGAAPEHIDLISSNPDEVTCPICDTHVPKSFYESFTGNNKLGYNQAMEFCTAHKAFTARPDPAKLPYPKIDWANFEKRLRRYRRELVAILERRKASTYRADLEEKVATGQSRAAMRNPEALASNQMARSAGYYGAKGASLMTEHILTRFGGKIREIAQTDALFAEIGVPGFVRGVLVPELVLLLVMEDFENCEEDKARQIIEESSEIGELLNDFGDGITEKQVLDIERNSGFPQKGLRERPGGSVDISNLSEFDDDDELDELQDLPKFSKQASTGAKRQTRSKGNVEIISLDS